MRTHKINNRIITAEAAVVLGVSLEQFRDFLISYFRITAPLLVQHKSCVKGGFLRVIEPKSHMRSICMNKYICSHACMPEHYVFIHTYLPLADKRLWRDRDMSMKRSEMRMLGLYICPACLHARTLCIYSYISAFGR